MSLGSVACTKPASTNTDFLQSPLIIGASVSGDYLTPSPGKVLALKHTTADQIKVISQNGKPGSEVLRRLTAETLKDRTSIIGVDLFFWDSFSAQSDASLKELKRLVKLASDEDLPLVIGDIPVLMPAMQKSVGPLNKALREACETYSKCKILPMGALLKEAFSSGSLTHNGKKYALKELVPDGLHIGKPASEYLAEQIWDLVQKR